MLKPLPNQRHITYKRREVPVYIPIEEKLMNEMGLTISDLHKEGVKALWNSRQRDKLQLVWDRYGKEDAATRYNSWRQRLEDVEDPYE